MKVQTPASCENPGSRRGSGRAAAVDCVKQDREDCQSGLAIGTGEKKLPEQLSQPV
ncbi:hypothetical protein RISK_005018 [Rhodopirellula islandica]|uniref:Uncharacterized protein n=1 Tax=Rhodopirellula islandica TaxID=595434 RepID=A0A0J1B939_RHOIS|nr:hypothetical protein RISK_005018 [Rhodopirellula islandica]